jgi:hypothetical protein
MKFGVNLLKTVLVSRARARTNPTPKRLKSQRKTFPNYSNLACFAPLRESWLSYVSERCEPGSGARDKTSDF